MLTRPTGLSGAAFVGRLRASGVSRESPPVLDGYSGIDQPAKVARTIVALTAWLVALPVQASPPVVEPATPSNPDAVVEIQAPEPPQIEAEQVDAASQAEPEGPRPPDELEALDEPVATPPPPNLPAGEQVRVAVGLSPEALGDKREKALLDQLEQSVRASAQPPTEVRRLRVGAAESRVICREGRDDLVITIGYLADRPDPVVFSFDCRIDQELGVRPIAAVDEVGLVGVLWDEHRDRVAAGARERRRTAISPKVKTGLIAGAAVLVIGAAIGLLISSAFTRETVVLKVSPGPAP